MAGCPCDKSNPNQYAICAGDTIKIIAPTSVMTQYAAQAGAKSTDWTMCVTMAFLAARRMEYWKNTPGDCGSATKLQLTGSFTGIATAGKGLTAAASLDPEPISKGILAGVAAIFGGFTAHHAQAVATEQSVACNVSLSFNYVVGSLEPAVAGGQISAVQASAILGQAYGQLVPQLQTIAKPGNLGYGHLIAMKALYNFFDDIVFPAMEAAARSQGYAAPPPSFTAPPANPYMPAPSSPPLFTAPAAFPQPPAPSALPPSVGTFQGSSGYVPIPMNANNPGVGPTGAASGWLTPGTILVIGGIAYVASKAGGAA
jgi:hypothetical protein